MAKGKRGGRSVRKQPYDEYKVIGMANNGTIKVIKAKPNSKNAGIPMYSNRKNTVYFIVNAKNALKKGRDEITNIAVYRNRRLVYNLDFSDAKNKNDHAHYWNVAKINGKEVLVKVGDHDENLKPAQQKLFRMARDWNIGGK